MLQRAGRRLRGRTPTEPSPDSFPRSEPAIARPRASHDLFLATWVGHSTFILQIGGLNLLTDPMWGRRASPLPGLGPKRWVPPAPSIDALPPIDLILQSHNHYDHLDRSTVRALARRHPEAQWMAPLGVAGILRRHGVQRVIELDWWDSLRIGDANVGCAPARHFSGRGLRDRNVTLWCAWSVEAAGYRAFFAADTGLHPEFDRIADRFGPFDLAMLPIGAYEPQWFMRPVHLAPWEIPDVYRGLRSAAPDRRLLMAGMHWGTFKLTDEPMDDPPRRTRDEWLKAGLSEDVLWIPRHGETRAIGGGSQTTAGG